MQQVKQNKEYNEIKLMNSAIKRKNINLTQLKTDQNRVMEKKLNGMQMDNYRLIEEIGKKNAEIHSLIETIKEKDRALKNLDDKTININVLVHKIRNMNKNFDKEKNNMKLNQNN